MRKVWRSGTGALAAVGSRTGNVALADPVALALLLTFLVVSTPTWSSERSESVAAGTTSEADASMGRRLYAAQCAACHGAKAEGQPQWDEPNVAGEMPAPPHDAQGHTWKHSDAMLYRIVRQGWRDPFNKTRHLTMPAFGDVLSPGETRAVIDSLKALWTTEQQQFQKTESEQSPYPVEAH